LPLQDASPRTGVPAARTKERLRTLAAQNTIRACLSLFAMGCAAGCGDAPPSPELGTAQEVVLNNVADITVGDEHACVIKIATEKRCSCMDRHGRAVLDAAREDNDGRLTFQDAMTRLPSIAT